MASDYVRQVGSVEDFDGGRLIVGVDHDTVTIGSPSGQVGWRLTSDVAEDFAQLFVSACWEAGRNGRETAAEADGG